ncbi:hypothetical protein CA13_64070 [Planctomycetes bacterium CA13]|uniref:Methyltransferase domain-containing protein n=1 Tax=Novipirellula herctigrandis TaxID=2527986 RepID=A0A5C5ZCN4_9BACT|nr:hypothetical protein CA13_64070 [Planctomycetes bacterium CA13]
MERTEMRNQMKRIPMRLSNLLPSVRCWGMVRLATIIVTFLTLESCSSIQAADDTQALPPIECPLSKAGIDKTKLKPFEEVQDYIKFLERSDRAEWQKSEAVVQALELKGTETVVDRGSGSGYFTFRLSKAVPQGKAIAISPELTCNLQAIVATLRLVHFFPRRIFWISICKPLSSWRR